MIKKLVINKYRKLKSIELDFHKDINLISGANGTCKTSVLYLISNSFMAVNKKEPWVNDTKCLNN